jgi:hypothetical protein
MIEAETTLAMLPKIPSRVSRLAEAGRRRMTALRAE